MYPDPVAQAVSALNIPIITAISLIIDNDIIFSLLIIGLSFIAVKEWKRRNLLILTLMFLFLVGFGIKLAVQESRPCTEVISKISCPNDYSFPSTHTLVAFALATALWKKPYRWLYVLFAAFVAFTRVYLGVHVLMDVIGGALLGIFGCLAIMMIWEKLPPKIKDPLAFIVE